MEYKVLWVDDQEFPALLTIAETMGLDITHVKCWLEAEPLLENHFDEWSALILDCYCPIEPNGPENPKFLREVFPRLNRLQGNHRVLPWYVLSQGNKERFDEIIDNTLSDDRLKWDSSWSKGYYSKSAIDAATQKQDWQIMLNNILNVAVQSDDNKIRQKYPEAFEAARFIGGNVEHDLLDFLVNDLHNDLTDTYRYYNWARNIMEGVFLHGKKNKILPPLSDTNGYGALLDKGKIQGWKLKKHDSFIPKALGHAVSFLLDFTNQGSHFMTTDMVNSYVKETNNINLFRAMLYIEMDLLVWYHQLFMKINDYSNIHYQIGDLWEPYNTNTSMTNVKVTVINKKGIHYVVCSDGITVELFPEKGVTPPELKEGAFVNINRYNEGHKNTEIASCFCYHNQYTILYKEVIIRDQDGQELIKDTVNGLKKARVLGNEKCYKGMSQMIEVFPKDGYYIDSINQSSGYCENLSIQNHMSNATIEIPELVDDLSFKATVLPCPKLDITSSEKIRGSVTGGGCFTPGSAISISALPSIGYEFKEWQGCEPKDKYRAKTTLIMPNRNVSIVAVFKEKQHI